MSSVTRATVVLAVLLLPLVSVDLVSAEGSFTTVLITEVDPYNEGFTLANLSSKDVDLKGYSVSDGEGTLTFNEKFVISAGSSRTFAAKIGTDWFTSRSDVVAYGSSGTVKTGSLVLSNSVDDLALLDPLGTVVDSVCYGSTGSVDGWNGTPLTVSSGHYLMRTSDTDTDTSSDWISTRPGWTNLAFSSDLSYEAEVTPFTFPESRGVPVFEAVSSAVSSVDVSIYLISSPNMAALLARLAENGVSVRILFEGEPLGTNTSTELALMKSVVDAGGDVRVINSGDNTRYTYVHNKYAVVDGETVVVTSENWTSLNLGSGGNRGWGVVVRSTGYAAYMESVFDNDFSTAFGDVRSLTDVYPEVTAYGDLYYTDPGSYETSTYSATVTPVVSPDNSFSALEQFVSSADTRVLAEQMDLASSLSSTSGDTPVAWMAERASAGVEVRFILDSSTSTTEHEGYVDKINVTSGISALAVNGRSGFSLIHNKGVIVDDGVWVGSVNWTPNSFGNNREVAVIVRSQQVSDYFATYFMEDYGVTLDMVEDNGLSLDVKVVENGGDLYVLMSAEEVDGYEYVWSLGDGQTRTTSVSSVVFRAPGAGDYTAVVTLKGTSVTDSASYHVGGTGDGAAVLVCLAAVVLFVTGTLVSVVHERVRRSRRGRRRTRTSHRLRSVLTGRGYRSDRCAFGARGSWCGDTCRQAV